ncbi:Gfo/Idh/MocA family protein [Phocaeicola sp.]
MIRIGIICPSEIAARRFLPALRKAGNFCFAGVAIADKTEFKGATDVVIEAERAKAQAMIDNYGGRLFESYYALITSDEVDAVYLPLPPGLHYQWARQALEAGKYVLVEKPATTSLTDTADLIERAREKKLAVHENYMFVFHKQIQEVNDIVASGEIGDVRLYRIDFGFPMRAVNDFRYKKNLGGGALLDCGGYTLKYASLLLGDTARVDYARLNGIEGFEVDMYGSCAMSNTEGQVAQVSFGMDNDYRCNLEVWGSKGTLRSGRILTAPEGFVPSYTISRNGEITEGKFSADDAFLKSIQHFEDCVASEEVREENYRILMKQAELVEEFKNKANH